MRHRVALAGLSFLLLAAAVAYGADFKPTPSYTSWKAASPNVAGLEARTRCFNELHFGWTYQLQFRNQSSSDVAFSWSVIVATSGKEITGTATLKAGYTGKPILLKLLCSNTNKMPPISLNVSVNEAR